MFQLRQYAANLIEIRCFSTWGGSAVVGLVVAGIFLLTMGGKVISLHCTRLGPGIVSCDYRAGWLGLPGATETFEVRGAKLAGEGGIYRVSLITDGGEQPITHVWAGGYWRQRDLTVRINEFLADWERDTLTIVSFYPWYRYLLLVAPLLLGLLLWSLLPIVTLTLQKGGNLTVRRRTWWRVTTHAYPLSAIEAVLLEPRPLRSALLHLRPVALAPRPHALPGLTPRTRARLIALINAF